MINLFKKKLNLRVCPPSEVSKIARQLGLFMLVWLKTFFLCLKFSELRGKQDLITGRSWILKTYLPQCNLENEIDCGDGGANDERRTKWPPLTQKRARVRKEIWYWNFKQPFEMLVSSLKGVSKWNLNFEWLRLVKDAKTKKKRSSSHTLGTHYL